MLQCYHLYPLPSKIKGDPSEINAIIRPPHYHSSIKKIPIEEGEIVLLKDERDAITWYCAQVLEKLPDYVKVSYFTTETLALANYVGATLKERIRSFKGGCFPQNLVPDGRESHYSCTCEFEEKVSTLDWENSHRLPG